MQRLRAWADVDVPYEQRKGTRQTLYVADTPDAKTVAVTDFDNDSVFPSVVEKEVNLVTSHIFNEPGMHGVCIDIDMPCELVPSKTPGHFHLYIEKKLPWHKYEALLRALAEAEIIEPGYAGASIARGATCLRLPDNYYHDRLQQVAEDSAALVEELQKDVCLSGS